MRSKGIWSKDHMRIVQYPGGSTYIGAEVLVSMDRGHPVYRAATPDEELLIYKLALADLIEKNSRRRRKDVDG